MDYRKKCDSKCDSKNCCDNRNCCHNVKPICPKPICPRLK